MKFKHLLLALATSVALVGPGLAAEFKIGLNEDPDLLDPDQARSFVGRIVFASLCDKLVDITPGLEIIPQLATAWNWSDDGMELTMDLRQGVTFQDGTPFDAAAVVANIDRSQTLPESRRKSELTSVEKIEATGDHQVKFTLKAPDATLLAQLADRAGMMMSPTAFNASGLDFANNPVCSGPFSFGERVQQDRIVLNKYDGYWNADAIHVDKVTFLPIPDTTVRLANLRAGDLDMLERLAATDVKSVKADPNLSEAEAVSLGYQGITVNIANGAGAGSPIGNSKLVRQAFSWALDREAINQVVFDGAFAAGNQPFPPTSPWYTKDLPVPPRDVAKAKALLKEAGYDKVDVELTVANNPVNQQLGQVIQAMANEAGFNVSLKSTEFATLLSAQSAGDYQTDQIGWSGRIDPDGNIYSFVVTGGGLNDNDYSNPEVDKLLNEARTNNDIATRKSLYDQANHILDDELPIIYLYHQTWIWALSKDIKGFVPYPDGMIRLEGVTKG